MKNYRKKPKQQAIDNLLKVYAAIGAAARADQEEPAPTDKQKRLSHAPECTRTNENQTGDIIT